MFPKLSNKFLVAFVVLSIILFSCQGNSDLESWLTIKHKYKIPEGESWVIVSEGCGSCIETYSSLLRKRLEREDIHFIVSGKSGLRQMYLNCGLVPYSTYSNVLFDSSGYLLDKDIMVRNYIK